MLSSINQLLAAFEKYNITYCHWKSNEHLAEALEGNTDLDLLFDPAQRGMLRRVFAECGLKPFRATPLMQYNAIEDYIGFDREAAKIWHVHTHYQMTLGESHLKGYTVSPWGGQLLRDRVRGEENVWVSAPSDEFVLLMIRIALKYLWRDRFRKLSGDDLDEIEWLRERTDREDICSAADRLIDEQSKREILSLYDSKLERKAQMIPLRRLLRKELKGYTGYNRISSWFARSTREFFWLCGGIKRRLCPSNCSAYRRVSPSGGRLVAIVGCDGAGKSTLVSHIAREFGKKIDVAVFYLGSGKGSSSLLRRPMKLVAERIGGRGVGRRVAEEYRERKSVSLKSRLFSAAKVLWAVALAQEKKRKQRMMVKARNNGLLVLTDRYPQSDYPGASDGPLLSRYRDNDHGLLKQIAEWEQGVYERFSRNTPDLAIKLTVPTETAIARKSEMSAEEIENKKRIVMGIEISERTVIIDTSRPLDIALGEAMKAIWEVL